MPVFSIEMKVRDYECDLQGIVNNGVYFNYLEHARHEYLSAKGADFAALTAQKIYLVVTRSVLNYKASLTSGDRFCIHTTVEREGKLRCNFMQKVIRCSDKRVCLTGVTTVAALNEYGRPFICPEMEVLFDACNNK